MDESKHVTIEGARLLDFDFKRMRHFTIVKDETPVEVYLVEKDKHHQGEMQLEMEVIENLKGRLVDLIIFPHEYTYRDDAGIRRLKTTYYLVSIEEKHMAELRKYSVTQERTILVSATNTIDAANLASRAFSSTKKPEDQLNIHSPILERTLDVREES